MFPLLDDFLRLFCPTPCLGCASARGPVCPACLSSLGEGPVHRVCSQAHPPILSLGEYRGLLRSAIHSAKFARNPACAERLADLLAAKLVRELPSLGFPQALVTPPVEPGRTRFHPGWILAQQLSRTLGVPQLECLLVHTPDRTPTHRLPGGDRSAHLERHLRAGGSPPEGIRRVLFVDDLLTTGSTARRVDSLLRPRGLRITAWVALARVSKRHRISRKAAPDLSHREESSPPRILVDRSRLAPGAPPSLDDPASSW